MVGAAKNWLNLFTRKIISNIVKVACCKALIMLLHRVTSSKVLLSVLVRGIPTTTRVEQGVWSCMLTLWRKSAMHLVCDRWRPDLFLVT